MNSHKVKILSARSAFTVIFGTALLAIAGSDSQIHAEQPLSTLLKKVPGSANAIIAIDSARLRNSPLGEKEDWTSKNEAAYVKTPFLLPPESNLLVVASQMNPDQSFKQSYEMAIMSLSEPITPRSIARAEGGQLDEINGIPSVQTPNDAYFVTFSEDLLGIMSPANRQEVARWIVNENPELSTYLVDSANQLLGDPQIVLAIDLENAIMPSRIEEAIQSAEFLKPEDYAVWQEIIQSLQGAALAVQVTDKILGSLHVDFGNDPTPLGECAQQAIYLALSHRGIGLESLDKWKMDQSGNQIRLSGELSEPDLRKLMSLLELPSANFDLLKDKDVAGESDLDQIATASKAYFTSVSTLLDDLENEFRTNRDARHGYARTYLQRYGKRIDQLPILNVDSELVDYGMKVAETLRDVSVTQSSANIQKGVRTSQVYTPTNQYGYAYSSNRSTSSMKNQINREEQSVAMNARFSSWKEIQDATAQMRVEMTQKYKMEF